MVLRSFLLSEINCEKQKMANNENIEVDREISNAELEEFLDDAFEREFPDEENPYIEFKVSNSAFGKRIREFNLINHGYKSIVEFLINAFEIYNTKISEAIAEYELIKTVLYLSADLERSFHIEGENDTITEKREIHIPTKNLEMNTTTDAHALYQKEVINHIVQKIDEVMVEGSGFTLSKINHIRVQIFKYEPLRGAGYIELPKLLKSKRGIVNLKNTYDECFKWAILSALHYNEVYTKNRTDALSYSIWRNELNFDGIEFPVRLNQIEKFMRQNEHLAVNVYYFDEEKKCIFPRFLASKPLETHYIHLLMLTESTSTGIHSHYCWIKNLSSLVGSQINKHKDKKWLCDRCLVSFNSSTKLEKHRMLCESINECAIEMPREGINNFDSFKNYKNELKIPFIVYVDTEAILKKIETDIYKADCSTHAHQQHEVHSIGYYFKCENDETKSRYVSFRGENCVEWFMKQLKVIALDVFEFLEDKKLMSPLNEEEEKKFNEAIICHICKKEFGNGLDTIRVKDHCHTSGDKYK